MTKLIKIHKFTINIFYDYTLLKDNLTRKLFIFILSILVSYNKKLIKDEIFFLSPRKIKGNTPIFSRNVPIIVFAYLNPCIAVSCIIVINLNFEML